MNTDIYLSEAQQLRRITTFAGHFDGQGHTINVSSDILFHTISIDVTSDIALRNLNVTGIVNLGGGIVRSLNSGVIENCSFSGLVEYGAGIAYYMNGGNISSDLGMNGGIVYLLYGGKINNCKIAQGATITGWAVGGIAGYMRGENSYIKGCTSHANILNAQYIGGILGRISSYSANRSHVTDNILHSSRA